MLTPRPFWVDRIEALWRSRSIVWLAGTRRLGKTVLGRQIPEAQGSGGPEGPRPRA